MRSRRCRWSLAVILWVLAAPCALAQSDGATDVFGRGIARLRGNGAEAVLDLRVPAHGILLLLSEDGEPSLVRVGLFSGGHSVVTLPARLNESVPVQGLGTTPIAADEAAAARAQARARAACTGSRGGGANPAGDRPNPNAGTPATVSGSRMADCSGVGMAAAPAAPPAPTRLLRAPTRTWVLLVLTDQPVDSAAVLARLEAMPRSDVQRAAHDVAEFLVGRLSPMWAGYLIQR